MTISYRKLRGLSKTVRGVVGFFVHSNYQILNQDEKKGKLAIEDRKVDVAWTKMTKHVTCWRIPKDQVISLLGIENLNPRRTLR